MDNRSGFTLLEVVFSLIIAGIVVALAIIIYGGLLDSSRDSKRDRDARLVLIAAQRYRNDKGITPTTFAQIKPYMAPWHIYSDSEVNPIGIWKTNTPPTAGDLIVYTSSTDPGNAPDASGSLSSDNLAVITKAKCSPASATDAIESGHHQQLVVIYKKEKGQIICVGNSSRG